MVIFKSNRFTANWYGYLTNQSGHKFEVGLRFLLYTCVVYFLFTNDFPKKEFLYLLPVVYLCYELFWQKSPVGVDLFSDTMNVAYGVWIPTYVFNHIEIGSPKVEGDPVLIVALMTIPLIHNAIGVLIRLYERYVLKLDPEHG